VVCVAGGCGGVNAAGKGNADRRGGLCICMLNAVRWSAANRQVGTIALPATPNRTRSLSEITCIMIKPIRLFRAAAP
jgi:hypothetical protein